MKLELCGLYIHFIPKDLPIYSLQQNPARKNTLVFLTGNWNWIASNASVLPFILHQLRLHYFPLTSKVHSNISFHHWLQNREGREHRAFLKLSEGNARTLWSKGQQLQPIGKTQLWPIYVYSLCDKNSFYTLKGRRERVGGRRGGSRGEKGRMEGRKKEEMFYVHCNT